MVDSDDLYGPMEVDDDLSIALGAETLADRNMVPPGFDNTLGSSADTLPIDIFEHRRFLRVERSATLRSGQKVSKIWDHGIEYRLVARSAMAIPHNFFMGLRYSFYTCNVRGVRESLQQCKEADHTGEKCLGR
jgi:hypothetical protein